MQLDWLMLPDLDEWHISVNIASGYEQQQQVSGVCSFFLWGDLFAGVYCFILQRIVGVQQVGCI